MSAKSPRDFLLARLRKTARPFRTLYFLKGTFCHLKKELSPCLGLCSVERALGRWEIAPAERGPRAM